MDLRNQIPQRRDAAVHLWQHWTDANMLLMLYLSSCPHVNFNEADNKRLRVILEQLKV